WSSSGSFAATRTTIRARTLFRASTDESRALPRMASDPARRPTNDLAATTARLATRRPMKTRRTRAVSGRPSGRESGMGCKLVREACLVNGSEQRALQISGLRDVEELRVIPAGAALREQLEPPAGAARQMQRERAVVGEQVERRAGPGVSGDEPAVLALVEERAGLLARPRRGEILHSVLHHLHDLRYLAGGERHLERQTLVPANRDVVAEQDAGGREGGSDARDHVVPPLLDSRRQELRHDVRTVAIHHQRRQAVSLGVYHAERRGGQTRASPGGGGDALAPPPRVDRLAAAREQPQPDLGPG